MRILVLILMSGGYPYDQFREIWRRYMKSHPNIDCYFYRGNPSMLTDYRLEGDTLWIRMSEKYHRIFDRTIYAFRYFMKTRPNTYTFMFRPNASALIDLNKYYELCKTFPTTNFCGAEIMRRGAVVEHPVEEAPSGAGYTLSMDLVKWFAETPGLQNVLIDDISIGYYLQILKVPITPVNKYTFTMREYSPEELKEIVDNHVHFRFNNLENRNWDIQSMNTVANIIYNKK
jgi:hypothetical protein